MLILNFWFTPFPHCYPLDKPDFKGSVTTVATVLNSMVVHRWWILAFIERDEESLESFKEGNNLIFF